MARPSFTNIRKKVLPSVVFMLLSSTSTAAPVQHSTVPEAVSTNSNISNSEECILSPDELSDSDGNELPYCLPGYHVTGTSCNTRVLGNCCRCERGTNVPGINICDKCFSIDEGVTSSEDVGRPTGEPPDTTTLTITNETHDRACPDVPCANNGSCVIDVNGTTHCACISGWEGEFCGEATGSVAWKYRLVVAGSFTLGILVGLVVHHCYVNRRHYLESSIDGTCSLAE